MVQRSASTVTYTVYPITNYSFGGTKDRKVEKDNSVQDRLARIKANYEKEGLRRSVEGILVVQQHNHPHILLLQMGLSFFRLPGGRLRPGEDETEGLKRKLVSIMSPTNTALQSPWDIGECAGVYWRPNFDTMFYPYLPPHITRPKEVKKLFVVPLPEHCMFSLPRNMKLIAVPIFDLYDNAPRYGPVIASIPLLLSRYRLTLVGTTLPSAVAQLPVQQGPEDGDAQNGH